MTTNNVRTAENWLTKYISGSRLRIVGASILKHWILITMAFLSTGPVLIVLLNSLKSRRAIFQFPYQLPNQETFDIVGYTTVFEKSEFLLYYFNSIFVTLISLFFILLLGLMVAFAVAEYPFPGNNFVRIFFLLGLIIPLRLGSVSIVRIMISLNLINTLWSLIIVYVAGGLSISIFILSTFMLQVPREMKDAARIDGANEYQVFRLVLPIVRPGIGTVAALAIIPMWNDLWFPLILAPGEATRTVTLGAQQFMGQFSSDWNAILASLTLSTVPVLIAYFISSKQLLQGLTAGAVKT